MICSIASTDELEVAEPIKTVKCCGSGRCGMRCPAANITKEVEDGTDWAAIQQEMRKAYKDVFPKGTFKYSEYPYI